MCVVQPVVPTGDLAAQRSRGVCCLWAQLEGSEFLFCSCRICNLDNNRYWRLCKEDRRNNDCAYSADIEMCFCKAQSYYKHQRHPIAIVSFPNTNRGETAD